MIATTSPPVLVKADAAGDALMIELPPGHRVDTNSYVLNVNEALDLGHQLIVKAAEILADRGRDG
jgi:hypothetical protein